ncbi:MAG: response regulator [bacterium]|nr:response regulator [bacterium]
MTQIENIFGKPSEVIHVLVVDDESSITDFMKAAIESYGYQTLTANSGEEALELFNTYPIDLVITDLAMPGMHGFELMEKLHTKNPDVVLIVFTILDTKETMREAMKRGAFDFLSKPILLTELEVTIRNAVELIHQRRAIRQAETQIEKMRSLLVQYDERKYEDTLLPKLFKGWKYEEYLQFRTIGKEITLNEGSRVEWENQSSIIVVLSGRIRIERNHSSILILRTGDAWGAFSLLQISFAPVTLIAEEESHIFRITPKEAISFFKVHEERLFKLWILNLIRQQTEWMDIVFQELSLTNRIKSHSSYN